MFDLNNVYHLFARHPGLANDSDFLYWLKANGASTWKEGDLAENGERDVLVLAKDQLTAFAARVKQDFITDQAALTTSINESVVARQEFDLLATITKQDALRKVLAGTLIAKSQVLGVFPNVEYKGGQYSGFHWVVQILKGDEAVSLAVDGDKLREVAKAAATKKHDKPSGPIVILNEWLATNEIHSPYLFKQQADSWTAGPLTIREKAFRIFSNVQRLYKYDSNITNISEFTWRDTLVRDTNGYRGICDEWAVVQISYLRSIGIESRLKLLIWTQNGQGVGHACLEFNEGSRWMHMDALWSAFDNPGRYRASGAQGLTVMDADFPADSRSTVPAWGVPDPTGDGKLYPYGDFVINPRYPGNQRSGYSS